MQEEEKLIMDEEVTSVESNDDEDEAERTLLTVALMKSVVDQKRSTGDGGDAAAAVGVTIAKSGTAGTLAPAVISGGGGTAKSSESVMDKPGEPMKQRLRKRRRQAGQALERLERSQTTNERGLAIAAVRGPKLKPLSTVRNPPEISISLSVPNPLSVPIPPIAESLSLPILPPPPPPPPPPGETSQKARGNNKIYHIEPSSSSTLVTTAMAAPLTVASAPNFTVPCPLPAASFEPASVVEMPAADAPAPVSIDAELEDRRKVNFDESLPRMRGFSIDLDCKYIESLVEKENDFVLCLTNPRLVAWF